MTQSLKARFLEPVGDQPGLFTVLARSIDIVVQRLTEAQLEQDGPDILLRPDVGDMHLLQFDRGEMCIAAGRQAVDEADEALRRIVVRGSTEDAEERRGTQKM